MTVIENKLRRHELKMDAAKAKRDALKVQLSNTDQSESPPLLRALAEAVEVLNALEKRRQVGVGLTFLNFRFWLSIRIGIDGVRPCRLMFD